MNIFTRNDKVNFVDTNNVILGYDLGQDCCEHAGWYITNEPKPYSYDIEEAEDQNDIDVSSYVFDRSYRNKGMASDDLDGGGIVVFRGVSESVAKDIYIHIFNSHNGYYGHGFEFEAGGESVSSGVI